MKTPDVIRVWPDFPARDNWCGGVWDNSNGPHGVDYIRNDPAVIRAAAMELPEFKALMVERDMLRTALAGLSLIAERPEYRLPSAKEIALEVIANIKSNTND